MPLCGNCFHELHTSGPCPLCGYDGTGKDKKHPQALRPGAILNGRHIVGRVLGQGGFGITLPGSLTGIGDYAFSDCEHLTNITLPDGLTSIGEYAFSGCTGLTGITLPESLTSIGSYAFDNYTAVYDGPQPLSISIHAPAGSYAAEFFKDDPRLVIDR